MLLLPLQDDEAIVYDNQRSRYTHTDQFIRVGPGLAHLSSTPFSGSHSWGAWRERRQFVGRVSYGAKVRASCRPRGALEHTENSFRRTMPIACVCSMAN
jgi:hypothetical protein